MTTLVNAQPFNLKFRPNKGVFPVIMAFREQYYFLSNYHEGCHVVLPAEGDYPEFTYNSTENAYMAWKTLDANLRSYMRSLSADDAKQFAKPENTEFKRRPDYSDEGRLAIMRNLSLQKYSVRNPALRQKLLETGSAVLIEGNDWGDTFFGFCLKLGHGQNHLGRILMETRALIQSGQA
jgi:predicted NAD-dependent protein-ADP-ribosyltransferase YbiA (DUF1768 family)